MTRILIAWAVTGFLGLSAAMPAAAETDKRPLSRPGDDPAAAATLSPDQKNAIRALIRDYLVENPEIIDEAMDALREKKRLAKATRERQALSLYREALVSDPETPVVGNPQGDVTIVEFFDYQCGYCKRVFPALMKTVKNDGNVRLALKEFPILGPQSRFAAEASLASREQGKYRAFHMALMVVRGKLTEAKVMAVARSVGIDTGKLRKDMRATKIQTAIELNFKLADALGIRGTPAFIIGDRLVPGAISIETLRDLIAKARRNS